MGHPHEGHRALRLADRPPLRDRRPQARSQPHRPGPRLHAVHGVRTIPEDREGNQQNNQQRDGLGWISDPYGIPCVSGERRSNAQQYLGSQALITAAGAGVASLIESDSGRMSYVGSDGSIGTVGITGQEAVGQILAGGVRDMSAWVNKLYGQAFAAVYVQPGAKVAVHLEKPLAIDFDPEGRKVDHRAGESHALELD